MSGITKSTSSSSDEDAELRRGPWSVEEDNLLIHYIDRHGEGRWNLLADRSGLRRTGKSCRLRWMNYLKPDVKRGNLTPQEQLSILELHSKWGNRWSKIAQHLPGRTDNEIKNYWRTRVQKQARNLNIDSNSDAFKEVVGRLWIPRLLQKIQASNTQNSSTIQPLNLEFPPPLQVREVIPFSNLENNQKNSSSENCTSSSISSSDEFMHMAPISEDPTSPYNDMGNNIDYNTFLKGFCSVENNNIFDKEPFSLQQTTSGMGDFGEPIGYRETVGNNWNDEIANGWWDMDKLW